MFVCVCACVCVRERERMGERERGRVSGYTLYIFNRADFVVFAIHPSINTVNTMELLYNNNNNLAISEGVRNILSRGFLENVTKFGNGT